MTEIMNNSFSKKNNFIRCKKLSTVIDLTPMVDLGFLLITFFIFTTTLSSNKVLNLVMPSNENVINKTLLANSKVLQLVLLGNNKLACYNGNDTKAFTTTGFATHELRQILLNKKTAIAQKFGNSEGMVVIIKPSTECKYKNLVDVLDELIINGISNYVLSEATNMDLASFNTL